MIQVVAVTVGMLGQHVLERQAESISAAEKLQPCPRPSTNLPCVCAVAKLQLSGARVLDCCSHVRDIFYDWLDDSSRCWASQW